jgi:P27 family predicted phage terminase small subunit
MRGRTSKPTALKSLQRNAGHRSKADRAGTEPAPPAGTPEPPPHLDDRAKRKWYAVLGVMMQVAGWATLMDGDVLAAYCSAYSRWEEAETDLPLLRAKLKKSKGDKRGPLINDINQMVGQSRNALRDMKTFGQEFGWSSASRTRIRINDGQLLLGGLGSTPPPAQQESEFERQSRLASS